MAATLAAEAAIAGGAIAKEAFAYNRENYMFDAGLRFGRFNTGYSMAIAQVSQYREDLRDLTELTCTKADTYHTVGTICFVLNFQLIMAGRLGVHGPSPPGWLLGMYWTNICAALMFLVMFTWMAMHSGARANAGMAHMLTRAVRLPIPTPKMLDEARMLGNEFEKQRVVDVFRVPFVAPAQKETELDPESGVRVPTGSGRRMPRWYHDEVNDLRPDEGGATPNEESNPEHFELYRGLQEEWWGYDVYARIGLFYFFSHWLAAASLYSMCHVFGELRCLWPAWTTCTMFITAHFGVLHLDIVAPVNGKMPKMEKVVPFVPYLCVLGMSIDYSVLDPTPWLQGFIYTLSWIGYAIYFAWALRMYELAMPQFQEEQPERPGGSWNPSSWPVPPAFKQSVYLIAAPKRLEPGNTCLLQEMKAAKGGKGNTVEPKKARDSQPAMLPWKLFRGALMTLIGMWVLIMCGRFFEQLNGERFILKQEGRVERWPSHMQPWMTPWTRKGSRNEWCHAGGCDRRLEAKDEVSATASKLMATLAPLAKAFQQESAQHEAHSKAHFALFQPAEVAWPQEFRPTLMAAGGDEVAFLEPTSHRVALADEALTGLSLTKLENLVAAIASVSLDKRGLVVADVLGDIFHCEGRPAQGSWSCGKLQVPSLPQGLASVSLARNAQGELKAALTFAGDDSVALMEARDGNWLPIGEVALPESEVPGAPKLAFHPDAEELMITTADGAVHLRNKDTVHKVSPVDASVGKKSHFACRMGSRVAHLSLAQHGKQAPKLMIAN
mmetsp:Transcript_20784/g.44376  ORF Transcript_20784/g.44376 Transcript_20784/m.44376 type:complete len:780 (+) Transcript_20784:90-2429(+)